MDFHQTYQQILGQIQSGGRPHLNLTPEQIAQLKSIIENNPVQPDIPMALCLLTHSYRFDRNLWPSLLVLLEQAPKLNVKLAHSILLCCQKHIIGLCIRDGESLPQEFIIHFKRIFDHPSVEVIITAIQILNETKPNTQLLFKREIQNKLPSWWRQLFYKEHRNLAKIIKNFLRGLM